MTSLAQPRLPARSRRLNLPAIFTERGSDVLLAVPLTLMAAVLLSRMTSCLNVDTWLALADGRYVAAHGLPHRDTLTVLGLGARWIDQQWLSQLIEYGLFRSGGLALVGVVNLFALLLPCAGCIVVARRHGARLTGFMPVLPLAAFLVVPAREVRTQDLAVPLFVAVAALLSADSRQTSRRVYWCLPLLALWANLHGTVSLGVMLVGARGLTLAVERRRLLRHDARAWLRPAALILGAPAAALVTPYGSAMLGYYHATMGSSTLRHWVSEWQPLTSSPPLAAAVLALVVLGAWACWRRPALLTGWEKLALVVLAAGSALVVRNILFLALLALMTIPVALNAPVRTADPSAAGARGRGLINAGLAATALGALILSTALALGRPNTALVAAGARPGVLTAVARAAAGDHSLRVLADGSLSDWLLWEDPQLAGRIAADARFEIYTPAQLSSLETALRDFGGQWQAQAAGYRLVVLDRSADTSTMRALLREPGHRVLYADRADIVILRAPRAGARS